MFWLVYFPHSSMLIEGKQPKPPSLAKSLHNRDFAVALRTISVMESNARRQHAIDDGYAFDMDPRRWMVEDGAGI